MASGKNKANTLSNITHATVSDTTTSIIANTATKVEINVAKPGKTAVAITGVLLFYPNAEYLCYFFLDVVAQKAVVYVKNTSNQDLTGVQVQCMYIPN